MKRIVIITKAKFPGGDASSLRYLHLSFLLQKAGYAVFIIGMGSSRYQVETEIEGIKYISLKSRNHKLIYRFFDNFRFVSRALRFVERFLSDSNVVMVGGTFSSGSLKKILKFSKKKNVRIVFNVMEWYSKNIIPTGGLLARFGHQRNLALMRWIQPSYGGVISISSFLNEYFTSKGINSVNVPFVMDSTKICEPTYLKHDKTIFLYVGHPGRKDDYEMMLKGFSNCTGTNKNKFIVYFVGIEKESISKESINIDFANIRFLGKMSHEKVEEYFHISDFTILMRPPFERYSKAGFPTKVVESLFAGIPVISNLTSDLKLFLIDGVNSVVVEEYSVKSFENAIKRALSFSDIQIREMKANAFKTAKEKLDINVYLDPFQKFMEELK